MRDRSSERWTVLKPANSGPMRLLFGVVLSCTLAMVPEQAFANCTPGGAMTYDDISGIAMKTCGTVHYHYEAWALKSGLAVFFGQANAPIQGTREGWGNYALFQRMAEALRDADYFSHSTEKFA
jgi:hypothetical protein